MEQWQVNFNHYFPYLTSHMVLMNPRMRFTNFELSSISLLTFFLLRVYYYSQLSCGTLLPCELPLILQLTHMISSSGYSAFYFSLLNFILLDFILFPQFLKIILNFNVALQVACDLPPGPAEFIGASQIRKETDNITELISV